MSGAGYLIATKEGIKGESGLFYDYILGKNGLFLFGGNAHIQATICIAPADVRGLVPVTERINIVHGKIPYRLYELALSTCLIKPLKERFVAIIWRRGEYHIEYPEQNGTPSGVQYSIPVNVVMDVHSHGGMPAFFSSTDDRDEQGFKLSLVLGKVEQEPEYKLRCCVYGYFKELEFSEVIDCTSSETCLPSKEACLPGQPPLWDVEAPAASSPKDLLEFFLDKLESFW